jgi:hypothetical protein
MKIFDIDLKLIQESQINQKIQYGKLEWIKYNEKYCIEYIVLGIYKAIRKAIAKEKGMENRSNNIWRDRWK